MKKPAPPPWIPVPLKPSRHPVPPGFSPDAKAWDVGEALAIVDYRPDLGWSLVVSHKTRPPSFRELMSARQRLVPQGLQMAVPIPPFSGHAQEGVRFVYMVEVELPRVFDLGSAAQPEPPADDPTPTLEPRASALDYVPSMLRQPAKTPDA